MASDSPDPPQLAPAPEPFKFGSFKDLLNNVETIQTTGADGKEHFVQKEIEKDPIAERFVQEAKNRIGGLVNDISVIARENPRLVAPFHGFINTVTQLNDQDLADWTNTVRPEDFRELKDNLIRTNTFLNNENWDHYDHQLELNLTARGLADSTTANEKRALAMRERSISNDIIRNNAEMVGDQLATTDLARKQTLYEGRRAARGRAADIAGQELGLQQEELNKGLMGRDDRLSKLMTLLGLNQNIVNEDINKKRGANIAPTVLGAQSNITGQQNSVWAQNNNNALQQYQIESQNANTNKSMLADFAKTGITLAALPFMPGLSATTAAAGTGASSFVPRMFTNLYGDKMRI